MEVVPVVCEIPGCRTTQNEVDAEMSTFLSAYCDTCSRHRDGLPCECPLPSSRTYKSAMFISMTNILKLSLPQGKNSLSICFKHKELVSTARQSLSRTAETQSLVGNKVFKLKHKNYAETILLPGLDELPSAHYDDVMFICSDAVRVRTSSLILTSLSGYMKEALEGTSYSISLPNVHSGDLQLFFELILSNRDKIDSRVRPYDCIKLERIASIFRVSEFSEFFYESEDEDSDGSCSDEDDCMKSSSDESESEEPLLTENKFSDKGLSPIYLNAGDPSYSCIICSQTMRKAVDMIAHYFDVYGVQCGLICGLCQIQPPNQVFFPSPMALSHHRQETHGVVDLLSNCELCTEPCFTAPCLEAHFKEEHPQEYDPVACDMCRDSFPKGSYLSKHMALKHSGSEE